MKLSLCFSGQPRFVKECYQKIINNVIGDYDIDIFAHLWFDEDLQTKPYKHGGNGGWKDQRISNNAIDDFIEIYNPIRSLVEPSKSFGDFDLDEDDDGDGWNDTQELDCNSDPLSSSSTPLDTDGDSLCDELDDDDDGDGGGDGCAFVDRR